MPEETNNLPVETTPNQPVVDGQSVSTSTTPTSVTPASEPPVEEWDKERAAATIKAQREQEKALKAQLKELEQLKAEKKQREDAALTESERLQKRAGELEAQNAKLMTDIIRRDVINETGLPAIFADRLKGTTKEEMLADAKEIAKILPPPVKVPPRVPPTNPADGNPNETEQQMRERLFGKNTNIFDVKAIREQGGGVVWNTPTENK